MVKPILLLDCGNTRVKYRLDNEVGVLSSDYSINSMLARGSLSGVLVSDVAGRYSAIERMSIENKIKCLPCVVEDNFNGLALAYRDIKALGVDRWLAMIAAKELYNGKPAIVVDAGTAIKIDVVDARGVHLGGSISLGLRLCNETLHNATSRLPEVDFEFDGNIGTDTVSCIKYGIIMSVVSLIERTMLKFPGSNVVLTGGDAQLIESHLQIDGNIQPNLVLSGMMIYSRVKSIESWGAK